MTDSPAYSIRSLVHAYGPKTVLDIPALDIPREGIYAFTGPNGGGKSTLFSILALLLAPVSGSVLLCGSEAAGSRDRKLRLKVTLLHQKPVLFSTTVRGNIGYGLRAIGLAKREARARVDSILETMMLRAIAGKPARQLSGGEAQRVALARALVLETPVLLLDEPTHSLDDASRSVLAGLLAQARQARSTTILVATHDLDFVRPLADRVYGMDRGKIVV